MLGAFRVSRLLGALSLSACALGTAGCDDPGATVKMTDARIFRDANRRVVVDVDLLGHEGLGGSVGTYCIRVVFVDPTDIRDECKADIEDGDTKTARFVGSDTLQPGAVVSVRVRLSAKDERRNLVVPP